MTTLPRVVNQLDGSRCASDNCGPATGAMALDYATRGGSRATGAAIRNLLPPPLDDHCGGTYIRNVVDAVNHGWPSAHVYSVREDVVSWTKVASSLAEGRGIHLGVRYSEIRKLLPSLVGSATFTGNHFWFVCGDWMCADPLWDGRMLANGKRAPSPVFRKVSPTTLSRIAGAFRASGSALGTGRAYVGITRIQPAPPVQPPEDTDVTITVVKGEDWTTAGGRRPYRAAPIRATLQAGYIEAGETVRTIAEATTPDGENWRLTERNGRPAWLLRVDFAPVTPGGGAAVDQGLTDYITRKVP